MNRVAPGYYQATVQTMLDGRPCYAAAEVVRSEDGKNWYIIMESEGHRFLEGADFYTTKRDAIEGLEDACARGFFHYPGLGICLR